MQLLCHRSQTLALRREGVVLARLLRQACLLFVLFCCGWGAQAQSQSQSSVPTDKLLSEVGQWVQQSQQLSANQFSFAPLDSRVQAQSCDRALVMDTPFAARETIRVRCLGNPSWQLYLRVVLKPGVAPGLVSGPVSGTVSQGSTPVTSAALVPSASTPGQTRRVVVANDLLRAGTVVSAGQVREMDYPASGVEPQALGSVKDVENAELVRDVQPGVPLRAFDIRRAVLVKQGQSVVLTVGQGSGFSITARVEALQDGKMGDQIRLKNPDSGRYLSGVVTGPNAARGL